MPIRELTYYDIKCDDCETCTATGSEHSAWSEEGDAVEDWQNGDNYHEWDSDTFLCYLHAPRCECGSTQDPDELPCPDCPPLPPAGRGRR